LQADFFFSRVSKADQFHVFLFWVLCSSFLVLNR